MKYKKIILAVACLMGGSLYSKDERVLGWDDFTINMYKQLRKEQQEKDPDQNLFFSPLSVRLALSDAYMGAREKTEEEIAHVLGAENQSQDEYHSHLVKVMNEISQENPAFTLAIANKIFIDKDLPIADSFKEKMHSYGSGFESIDFKNSKQACSRINGWVNEKTYEKISEIISKLSPEARSAIINAIYFKGSWVNTFEEYATNQKSFCKNSGNSTNVDMMWQTKQFNYMENDTFKMVELPYEGSRISMFAILPQDGKALDDVEESITATTLNNAIKTLRNAHVDIHMPKFEAEEGDSMNDILKSLGMPRAFNGREADFSGINDALYISDVIHKARIKIDEQGTEAAAATAVVMSERCAAFIPEDTKKFNANEPFILMIKDKPTTATFFMGRINNPNAQKKT